MERMGNRGIPARKQGMAIFLAGAVILAFVFFRAYYLFSAVPPALGPAPTGSTVMNLSDAAFTLVAQLGLLVVMTIAGGLILTRGVALFRGRAQEARE